MVMGRCNMKPREGEKARDVGLFWKLVRTRMGMV
jgi:hypothetical protein